MQKRIKVVGMLMVCVAALGMASCKEKKTAHAVPSKVVTAQLKSFNSPLYFQGKLLPLSSTPVTSIADARVKKINFTYGGQVTKGQQLLVLDSESLYKKFNDALDGFIKQKESYLVNAEDFKGTQMLYKAGVMSRSAFLSQQSTHNSTVLAYYKSRMELTKITSKVGIASGFIDKASFDNERDIVQSFKDKFSNIVVKSPGAGIAMFPVKADSSKSDSDDGTHQLTVGSAVKEGQSLLSVGNLQGYSVTFQVNEIQVNQVHPGMLAVVTGSAFPGLTLHGVITKVAAQADPSSMSSGMGMFDVLVQVKSLPKDISKTIRVGMSCKLRVDIKNKPQILIPLAAVSQNKSGLSQVTVVAVDGSRKTVNVTTGQTTADGQVAIISGLSVGDKVAVHD